jgi:prepilin-type N-terminal cleavage/methylation domain-containing protein
MDLNSVIKRKNGFTFAEVIVAAGIFGVISAIMLSFFIHGSSFWQLITNQSDLRSTARNALNYMEQELRNATRASTGNPSPNLTIPSKPNNNSVDFYLPSDIDGNGSIINSTGGTEWDTSNRIQYQYVPGQKQLRRLEQGNQHIIANDAAVVEFEDNSIDSALLNNELRVILTLQKVTPLNRSVSVTLTSIIKLRNQ